MRIERSIIWIAAALALLAAGGCADDDDQTGTTRPTAPPEINYACAPATGIDSTLPVRLVGGGVCGYDDGLGHVYYGVVLQNAGGDDLRDIGVEIDVRNSAGIRSGRSVPHRVHVVDPGQEIGLGYHSLAEAPPDQLTMRVHVYPLDVTNGPEAPADVTVSNVASALEGSTRTTSFTLTSTFGFPLRPLEVFVVYRDAAGAIVGGEQDLIESLEPQSSLDHTITSAYLNPAVTQVSVYVNENPWCPSILPLPGCP